MCSFKMAATMISQDEKLQDTVGIKPQLADQRATSLESQKVQNFKAETALPPVGTYRGKIHAK
jgi:hypothetical protein